MLRPPQADKGAFGCRNFPDIRRISDHLGNHIQVAVNGGRRHFGQSVRNEIQQVFGAQRRQFLVDESLGTQDAVDAGPLDISALVAGDNVVPIARHQVAQRRLGGARVIPNNADRQLRFDFRASLFGLFPCVKRDDLDAGPFATDPQLERRRELDELGFDALRGEQLPVGLRIRLAIEREVLIALGLGTRLDLPVRTVLNIAAARWLTSHGNSFRESYRKAI